MSTHDSASIPAKTAAAAFIGGVVLTGCAWLFAGAGHGSYFFTILCFAPLVVYPPAMMLVGPLLYLLYALAITLSRKPAKAAILVAIVHYGSFILWFVLADSMESMVEEFSRYREMGSEHPLVAAAGVVVFLMMQAGAVGVVCRQSKEAR